MLEWLKRRVILASPYCWLWEDSYEGKAYCKRLSLYPSIVITGKMIHEAKAYQKKRASERAFKRKTGKRLMVEWRTVHIPWLVLA